MNKKILLYILIGIIATVCVTYFSIKYSKPASIEQGNVQNEEKQVNEKKYNKTTTNINPEKINKIPLYNPQNNLISLYAISQISKLPDKTKEKIKEIDKERGIFSVLNNNKTSVSLITENPENYPGHEFEIITINNETGETKIKPVIETSQNTEFDIWEYDDITKNPLKHIKNDENGSLLYTEFWYYDDSNSIKYEKRGKENNIEAVKKETIDSDTQYRSEYILYDEKGNIDLNISIRYYGNQIVGFTYFDDDNTDISQTVIGELNDAGIKISEIVYTFDYRFKNKYTAEYKDGVLKDIKIYNDKNKVVETIISE